MTTIPSNNELYISILGKFETETSLTVSPWGKSFIRAFSRVLAFLQWLLYSGLAMAQKNSFVDTCDAGTLIRWGIIKIGRPPYQATQGKYLVQVTGSVGATIAANTTFKANDDSRSPSKMYVLDTAYTLATTTDHILLRALEGGEGSSLAVGDLLTATAPLGPVDSEVAVVSENVTPLNAEDIEVYRKIVWASFRAKSGSWSALDYRLVGSNVQGVQEIYAYARSAAINEIDVYIEAVPTEAVPDGTPTGTIITNVTNAIELKRPLVVKQVHYQAITVKTIDVAITEITALSSAQHTTITNALREALANVRPFIAAADDVALRQDSIATDFALNYCTNLYSVVAGAIPGVAFGTVTFTVDASAETSYNFDMGEIPYLNDVTFS